MDRETDKTDVLIVGGGPSGLSAAIRIKQLSKEFNKDIRVILLEKSAEIGQHIISGACIEPEPLKKLFKNDIDDLNKLFTPVTENKMRFLTKNKSFYLPHIPDSLINCSRAHALDSVIDTFSCLCNTSSRQTASDRLILDLTLDHTVSIGLSVGLYGPSLKNECSENSGTGNKGNVIVRLGHVCEWMGKMAEELGVEIYSGISASEESFQRGMELHSRVTIFSEGSRGSLSKELFSNENFALTKKSQSMVYGIGFKELWQIDENLHHDGLVEHTVGWPLDKNTYGGSFMYHLKSNDMPLVSIGFITIPQVGFKGGCIVGCSAGLMNVVKIKGTHNAVKSGVSAAEHIVNELMKTDTQSEEMVDMTDYDEIFRNGPVVKELYSCRNVKPSFNNRFGLYSEPDKSNNFDLASKHTKKIYQKPDNKISFDLLNSVALTNTNHDEDQPSHLTLKNDKIPIDRNLKLFDGPEQRFCPAGVYEFVESDGEMVLQINSQNCIHCKTCDIRDASFNINWVVPQGGEGPAYDGM
ncbi:hypothetical protein A3Q56_02472 [Intoshia linei]|uniref:Electron transfer flavoprotein-ubiquinone oxidoreductase n=1 Tax=Intoshia linei TaxID=1819745 RepID=A0A177B804_9BILA|nr:hypothetical protein A3Q56_02472 [Intoshia linei]